MDSINQKKRNIESCLPLAESVCKKVRTGIFGGSFNPIHNGHIELAKRLLGIAGLDEIWFVVSPQNPLKRQEGLLDDDTRLLMARMALQDEPRLVASDFEFRMPRPSYMWHTLQSMSKTYPSREFVLIIGADNWACFDRWFEWRKILDCYSVVIYPREDSPIDAASLPPNVRLADTGLFDVSSTEIRRRIMYGEPFGDLVPPCVERFIRSEGAYKKIRIKS